MSFVLDTNMSLQAVLSGSASAAQPEYHVCFIEYNPQNELTRPAMQRGALSHITDVTICSAPVANPAREVVHISIHNRDSQSNTVIVKTDDGTERTIIRQSLASAGAALNTLFFTKESGWKVI